LKELAAALKAEPGSIPRRLELASALREAGRPGDAIDLYRGVAEVYAEEGRLVQAMAVCKGILEIDPAHTETLEMLANLAQTRAMRAHEPFVDDEPTSIDRAIASMDDEPVPDQDFPPWTKAHARGKRLLDLPGGEDAHDTLDEPSDDVDESSLPPVPTVEPTRAAKRSVREPLYAEPERAETLIWDDDDEGRALLHDALAEPLPRTQLGVEPPPFPLLSELPRAAFVDLLAKLTVLQLDAGEVILREGELGDACYLIASGTVRVEKGGLELAVLGPGSFFGEFAVLADQRRHASVQTIEPVELLEIRRALIDQLVATHPGVARTLRRFYRERLMQTLLATAPFFAELTPAERVAVAERFRPRRFGRGARIVEQGQPGGGLYLILVGEVEIVREGKEGELVLGTLGEGSYFGEMSLLKAGTASATVRASRLLETVQLPPRDFYEVVSQHPVLWDQLRTEAERREMANHAIVAGEARSSDDIYLV
jgi:CRP-like cAMP-binding protein